MPQYLDVAEVAFQRAPRIDPTCARNSMTDRSGVSVRSSGTLGAMVVGYARIRPSTL